MGAMLSDGTLLELWVPGAPKTKGSLTFLGGRHVVENVKGSSAWRRMVANAARQWRAAAQLHEPFAGPVEVLAWFMLPVDPLQYGAGDLDKLLRNVLDALSAPKRPEDGSKCAGVYVDDNQVARIVSEKLGPAERHGLNLVVRHWNHLPTPSTSR